MDIEDDLFIHYTFTVTLPRIIDSLLLASTFTVKVEVEMLEEDQANIALRKIDYWLKYYVSGSIAISAANPGGFRMLLDENNSPRLENRLMVLPDEPTDDHLAMIFQSKLQAIADGAFAVGSVQISSEDAAGLAFTYVGDSEEELPTMEQWCGGPTWFDRPWWARSDVSTIDTLAPEGTDLSIRPSWAQTLDFLENESNNPDAVIIRADFEPKIIE